MHRNNYTIISIRLSDSIEIYVRNESKQFEKCSLFQKILTFS